MTDAPSWWWADLGGLPAPRPPSTVTSTPTSASSAAGYTGLWTAYYLAARSTPELDIVV